MTNILRDIAEANIPTSIVIIIPSGRYRVGASSYRFDTPKLKVAAEMLSSNHDSYH